LSRVIDHVSLGVGDLDRAQRFYDAVLAALGLRRLYSKAGSVTYGLGRGSDDFSIVQDGDRSSRAPEPTSL
jgi:catechol 2,3-dioxygenase-like lactoylglutathione lyase family enzyme